jgi:nucleotide-binding universal stress UspA family protein
MNHPQSSERIVVGIEGSDAAINAAKWAVAEATSRDIPLRLIHAIPERRPVQNPADEPMDVEYGETALRLASAALNAMGEPVKIEAQLVRGPPDSA